MHIWLNFDIALSVAILSLSKIALKFLMSFCFTIWGSDSAPFGCARWRVGSLRGSQFPAGSLLGQRQTPGGSSSCSARGNVQLRDRPGEILQFHLGRLGLQCLVFLDSFRIVVRLFN